MTDALTLSDLLTRRVSLQWYEGIAIVRGVAERLVEQQETGMRIPELHQIELGAGGSVTLAGGVPASEPVRRLGQLLQAMLTDAEVPVQLRLIVSQATAPIPSYSALTELDQALAYFERPDRTGLLKALFARAEIAGPGTGSDVALTLDGIAPLPDTKPAGPLAHPRRKTSGALVGIVAGLIAVLALSGAAALRVRSGGKTTEGREVSRATVAAADAVGAAVLAGVSAVSDRMGLGRIVAASAAASSSAPPAAVPSTPRRRARSVAAHVEPVRADVERVPPGRVAGQDDVPDQPTSLTEALPQQGDTLDQSADAATDSVVYAIGADGVLAPVGVGRQLPRPLSQTVYLTIDRGRASLNWGREADASWIELIIARDGSVESAKLLGDRPDVQGGMFLSAAKAWHFRPATKDGVAVRYRKTILVSFE